MRAASRAKWLTLDTMQNPSKQAQTGSSAAKSAVFCIPHFASPNAGCLAPSCARLLAHLSAARFWKLFDPRWRSVRW